MRPAGEAERISGDGFLCTDIHFPTDIDRLCEMKSAGANVYFILRNPNPQTCELRSKVPPHLLHPKMLLFDFPSKPAEKLLRRKVVRATRRNGQIFTLKAGRRTDNEQK